MNINLSLEKLPGRKILPTPSFRRLLLKNFHVCFGTQIEIKMHGRKRQTDPPSAEQQAATKKKLDMYRNLLEVALKGVSSTVASLNK